LVEIRKPHAQLPLSACPYKLSITYIHLFLSRYQFEVFHSSHRHLKNLLRNQQLNKDKGCSRDIISNLFDLTLSREI
jgi:hypothetical protein